MPSEAHKQPPAPGTYKWNFSDRRTKIGRPATSKEIQDCEADEIVFRANDRCHQENLLAQLLNGVRALIAPVDNLVSNWAYMVMTFSDFGTHTCIAELARI